MCDVTVPDGSHVIGGQKFLKRWLVKNTGICAWPIGTALAFVNGSVSGEPDDVTRVGPGDVTVVSVWLVAPLVPGKYKRYVILKSKILLFLHQFKILNLFSDILFSTWSLAVKKKKFGHGLWCHIEVPDR